ncbi:MAG: hypothetical protein KME64_40240 [Scytonematopsis contorta HA4267-MV1]|jgi:hypothetical protein|nr:hypothetical protein [Scytonematopsis contorta HA4267-MV1]
MFPLLSRVLLWLLIGAIAYTLFQRVYPQSNFFGRFVLGFFLVVLALAFINPNEPAVSSVWQVVSFPLKPLGASILMMIFAAQKIKGGAIDKPGGYLLGWALTILLLASTPAVAYFLVRAPLAMLGDDARLSQEIIQKVQLASATETSRKSEVVLLLAQAINAPTIGLNTGSNVADVTSNVLGDTILPAEELGRATLAFNPQDVSLRPYLLQNPGAIRTRGLRLQDFVPTAETLQITTNAWESYLNQIYFFLGGGRRR